MKSTPAFLLLCAIVSGLLVTSCRTSEDPQSVATVDFAGLTGSLVVVNSSSGHATKYRPEMADTPLPPCSTFKIVNTLIGLETGIVASPDERF